MEYEDLDGTYIYTYYVRDKDYRLEEIYVWVDGVTSRIPYTKFEFGKDEEWAFEVNMLKG